MTRFGTSFGRAVGCLSWDDFWSLPRAVANFGATRPSPADRRLSELGDARPPKVVTYGLLALPEVVKGTELVAVVPNRLAEQARRVLGVAVVPPPFGDVELVESLWWHPSRNTDPGHRWLRETLIKGSRRLESTHGAAPRAPAQSTEW